MIFNASTIPQFLIVFLIGFGISFGIGFLLILIPYLISSHKKKPKYQYKTKIKKEKYKMDEQVNNESEKGLYSVDGKNALDNYNYKNAGRRF